MKQFLLFAGADYYPVGGFNDFIGEFNSPEEAWKHLEDIDKLKHRPQLDWAHLVDTRSNAFVDWRLKYESKWVTEEEYHARVRET